MTQAAIPAPAWSPRRPVRTRPISGWFGDETSFARFISREFAPSQRRISTSVRVAVMCATTAVLLAIMHIDSEIGVLVVWLSSIQPQNSFSVRSALSFIVGAAVMMVIAVPTAGVLAEAPWLMLPFVGILAGAGTYWSFSSDHRSAWTYIQVIVIFGFYLVIYAPGDYGWSAAYDFSSVSVGIGVVVIFDNWVWPDPAEPILISSLVITLSHINQRLEVVARSYLAGRREVPVEDSATASALALHLTLLARASRESSDTRRHAQLLTAVTVTERVHLEVERLTITVNENVPTDLRQQVRSPLTDVLDAAHRLLQAYASHISGPSSQMEYEEIAQRLKAAIVALDHRSGVVIAAVRSADESRAAVNLADFILTLRRFTRLLEKTPDALPTPALALEGPRSLFDFGSTIDPETLRHSAKVGVAVMLAYIFSITSHHIETQTALFSALIAALPSYGATVRKSVLRLAGAIIGGLLAIPTMAVVSPNFETVVVYGAVILTIFLFMAYISQSHYRLAYAAVQGGTSFLVVYVALGPTDDYYTALWRVWGIALGLSAVAIVFFYLWPDYAGRKFLPQLRKLLRETLELLPASGATQLTEQRVITIEGDIVRGLRELLSTADDARLERAYTGVDPDDIIDACGTIRRVAYRLGTIVVCELEIGTRRTPQRLQSARDALLLAIKRRITDWLNFMESGERTAIETHSDHSDLEVPIREAQAALSAADGSGISTLPQEVRFPLLDEVASFNRLAVLMGEVDDYFSKLPEPAVLQSIRGVRE
jgi:uncharacterized membrane protein YccC